MNTIPPAYKRQASENADENFFSLRDLLESVAPGLEECVQAEHKAYPDQDHRQSAVAAQLQAEPQNQHGNHDRGENLPGNRLVDPKLFLHNHPADPRDYQYNRSKDRDRHAGHVEFRNEVLPDQSGQSRVLSGKHIIEIRKHVPHHIGDITGLAVSEKHQELFIGDVHAVALEHHVGKTSEGIHPGQCGNKGRYIDFRDPEALKNPDAQADQQHDQHRQPQIRASRHQDAADRRGKADHRADGKVNVAAGQDAQQHACRQHKNIGVFSNQSRQV